MSEKKYAIVSFTNESKVEVVPTSWLVDNNKAVKWPNCTLNSIMKYIKECHVPEDDWLIIPIRVLSFAKSFSSANHKATIAQDTSNLGTDSSTSEVETNCRKRVRPIRFCSSSDEEADILKEASKKRFKTPNPPSFREIQSSSLRFSEESLETQSVSLISGKNVSQSTKLEEKTVFAMFTQVFKSLETMQKDLKLLKDGLNNVQCQLSEVLTKEAPLKNISVLPDSISIPVKSDDDLVKLNLLLRGDKSLTSALAHYLFGISFGKTASAFILSITRKVLSQTVALQYSRLGRKGKKKFETIEEVYGAILAAAALKFTSTGREELSEKFGRALASACDWDGARAKRNSDIVL